MAGFLLAVQKSSGTCPQSFRRIPPAMLAWLGGKKRLVQLKKQLGARRAGGGATSTAAGGGPAWAATPAAASRTHKRLWEDEAPPSEQQSVAALPLAVTGAGGAASSGVLPPHVLGRPEQALLKRVKAVPRSLDLMALQMPGDWAPQAATSAGHAGGEPSAAPRQHPPPPTAALEASCSGGSAPRASCTP